MCPTTRMPLCDEVRGSHRTNFVLFSRLSLFFSDKIQIVTLSSLCYQYIFSSLVKICGYRMLHTYSVVVTELDFERVISDD